MTVCAHPLAARLAASRGRQEGQGLAEYSLLLVLIAIALIAVLTVIGGDITSALTEIGSSVGAATP